MKTFQGTRTCVTYEDVEVKAENYNEAMEKIMDDEDVKVLGERDGDYEVSGRLYKVTSVEG